MGTEMRECQNAMRAVVTTLTGVSNSTERHIASGDMETAVVKGYTSGLGFVQDARLVCFFIGKCVDCEWVLSAASEGDGSIKVRIDDGEDRSKKLLGEKGITRLDSSHDRWCKVPTLTIALASINDFAGCLLKEAIKTVEITVVDDVCGIFWLFISASEECIEVSTQLNHKALPQVRVHKYMVYIQADLHLVEISCLSM